MSALFTTLGTGVTQLRTDQDSVEGFCDSVMKIFQEVGRERTAQVSEAFERVGGLDLLESFQRDSQNEKIAEMARGII